MLEMIFFLIMSLKQSHRIEARDTMQIILVLGQFNFSPLVTRTSGGFRLNMFLMLCGLGRILNLLV